MLFKWLKILVAAALTAPAIMSTHDTRAQILSPVESEERTVVTLQDQSRGLTLNEPMVWLDTLPVISPTRGIRLPSGKYELEAEDSDYLYYRAPVPIEYRIFHNGQVTSDRYMPGGIYLSKAVISLVPAGAYMSSDDTHKTLTWKLGAEFTHAEGTKWTRTGT